jgi:hypothetical protein
MFVVIAGSLLAGCHPGGGDVEYIRVSSSEPQLLTDQLRTVSGRCGSHFFELSVQPGTFYNSDKGRIDVDPKVAVRINGVVKRYDATEPFVRDLFSVRAPSYRFQMTCYLQSARPGVQLRAYGVSYAGEAPEFHQALVAFDSDGSIFRYDNHAVDYSALHDFLP